MSFWRSNLQTSFVVKQITAEQHKDFIASQASRDDISFLQLPQWGLVKAGWDHESVGFYHSTDSNALIGAGLVLYNYIPKTKKCLAYLPEGPILDWHSSEAAQALTALISYTKSKGAFALRIGPTLVHKRWFANTIKDAIAAKDAKLLSQVPADEVCPEANRLAIQLAANGWIAPKDSGEHFQAGQPRFNFMLPVEGKTPDTILKGMNQLWRRNIKRATKFGVEVCQGDRGDLAAFHQVYLETASRDGFSPRPLSYFENMWDSLNDGETSHMRVYLARYEGQVVAATTWVQVNRHCWYSYGASTTTHREVRGSNAIQWQMIQDAIAAKANVYDLRGIVESISEDNPEIGLIQFKVGTGGQATAYLGEWDYPINPLIYRAFQFYLNRRNRK